MMASMIADKYKANFEMLTPRMGFNETTLEETFIQGLPQSILSKVYSQTSLLSSLDSWNMVVCNLDCLHAA